MCESLIESDSTVYITSAVPYVADLQKHSQVKSSAKRSLGVFLPLILVISSCNHQPSKQKEHILNVICYLLDLRGRYAEFPLFWEQTNVEYRPNHRPFRCMLSPSMYLTWSPSVQCQLRPSPFHLSLFDFQRSSSWIVRSALDWRPWPLKIERILKRLYNFWWEERDFKGRLHFVLPIHWNLTWSWKW